MVPDVPTSGLEPDNDTETDTDTDEDTDPEPDPGPPRTLNDYYDEYPPGYFDPDWQNPDPYRPGLHSYNSLRLPTPQDADSHRQPVYYDGGSRTSLSWVPTLYAGVVPNWQVIDPLPQVATRDDFTIHHGTNRDGAGRAAVTNYLDHASNGTGIVRRYVEPPTVLLMGDFTPEEQRVTREAVRLVNATLSENERIYVESTSVDQGIRSNVNASGIYFATGNEREGAIYLEFLPCHQYVRGCSGKVGTSWTWDKPGGTHHHSYVQINRGKSDSAQRGSVVASVVHEIVHALGVRGHVPVDVDPRSQYASLMLSTYSSNAAHRHYCIPSIAKHCAPSTRFLRERMSTALALGPKNPQASSARPYTLSSASPRGTDIFEPWAAGLAPTGDVADNPNLGIATWTGALLGFTPDEASVAGDAEISLDLGRETGQAAFTDLEQWSSGTAPGVAGTGTQWRDGDLHYSIGVRSNTFRETGGDDGTLTGIFTGPRHEGAAGTLERTDLTAAFGASRE